MSLKRTIQPKISEIRGGNSNGRRIPGKKFETVWVYIARLSYILFHSTQEKFPEIQTGIVGRMESARGILKCSKISYNL